MISLTFYKSKNNDILILIIVEINFQLNLIGLNVL